MMPVKQPLLSVCIITYNQEQYIQQCIEGALAQVVDFDMEIVIGDDHSKDGTAIICQRYADANPGKIRFINRPKNVGMIGNWVETIKACRGNYVALCEGDDYWTSPFKLQQQVNFLQANNDYNLCFHDAVIVNEKITNNAFEKYSDYEWNQLDYNKEVYNLSDLLHSTLCPTASVVFRKPLQFQLPAWYYSLPFADMPLFILMTGDKNIKLFSELWSVYRRHSASASATLNAGEAFTRGRISMYLHLHDSLPAQQKGEIPGLLKKYINQLPSIMNVNPTDLEKIKKILPGFYRFKKAGHYKKRVDTSLTRLKNKLRN